MKIILLILVITFPLFVLGQGLMQPELPPIDTTEFGKETISPEKTAIPNLISGGLLSPGFKLEPFAASNMTLSPEFYKNLNSEFDFLAQHSATTTTFPQRYFFNAGGLGDPFLNSVTVFSSDAYKLSDKFTVGGSSFGASSKFTAPLPTFDNSQYDIRGATMFMEYKVSKNFRIQTQVSVTNRGSNLIPHP